MVEASTLAIPELIVLPPTGGDDGRFDRTKDRELHAWPAPDGEIVAYSATRGDRCLFHLEGVATYGFRPEAGAVEASPSPGVSTALVEESYFRAALPFVLQARGVQALHASAIETAAGVVMICGRSGSGKSTLAYGLSQRGFPVCADDVVAFRADLEAISVLPLPFSVRLRPDAAALYFQAAGDSAEKFCAPIDPPDPLLQRRLALGLTLTPQLPRRVTIEVRELSPTEAFTTLLSHAYCFDPDQITFKEALVAAYMALARRVCFFEVALGAGIDRIEQRLDAVEALLTRRLELSRRRRSREVSRETEPI